METRAKIVFAISLFILSILLFRLFYLQNIDNDPYENRAKNNMISDITIEPSRGAIYDRNGTLLIDNRNSYNIYLVPERIENDTNSLITLASVLEINADSLFEEISDLSVKNREYRIRRNIDMKTYLRFAEKSKSIRGARILNEWRRNFPIETAPHILGYLSEIKEKDELKPGLKIGDLVGKEGIEFVYDSLLRGSKGLKQELRDVKSRKVSDYNPENWIKPKKGDDIYLTIDSRLQEFTENLMKDLSGSIVVMNCNNGEILAMASKPDYPLTVFSDKISPETWNELVNNPDRPLYSKAVQGEYAPGSILKMLNYLSAAELKVVNKSTIFYCPGGMTIGNSFKKCWLHSGHGDVNITGAIQMSCDTYFYEVAKNIDIDKWHNVLKRFGLGNKTGIDLRYERPGNVPDKKFYKSKFRGSMLGRYANLMIGQGEILITPLQAAVFTSALANDGYLLKPRLLKCNVSETDSIESTVEKSKIEVNLEDIKTVKNGMFHVVNTAGGTAYRSRSDKITYAGKTGTVENAHGGDHAWFTSFGPYDNPEISVVIFEEHGKHGSSVAPLAKKIYEYWYELYKQKK
ncbi:MAG: penicillin-binding protein 2 [Candidatus Delongbacteria bacterium]|nr:penicillin-binding protein 2 [Candidatus Delongbacteria bacterium]MBN2836096.1 penicillin-binding protein 2 [Candidatus Delongbacteria bacterium]